MTVSPQGQYMHGLRSKLLLILQAVRPAMGASTEQIHAILNEAGYQLLYRRYADLPHDYLRQVLEMLGEIIQKQLKNT